MKRRNFFILLGIVLLVPCALTACLNLTLPTKITTLEAVASTASESELVSTTVSESTATTALSEAAELAVQAQSARRELPDNFSYWYDSRIGQVVWQFDSYVSIVITSDSFCGGAHPNALMSSVCFDLNTGLPVPLTHFFTSPENEVAGLVVGLIFEQACREDNEYGPMLFDHSEAALYAAFNPENYYLTDEGFVFYYQPYEIAPYAAGLPAFLIPFADFTDVLRNLE